MSDVSITFTSAELDKLRQWPGLLGGQYQDPTLVRKLRAAHDHSQNPAHSPELRDTGDVTVWCVVRADSPDGPVEAQHWAVRRVDV